MVLDIWTSIPSAGKLISPLHSCWWQDIRGQQVPEQQLSRARQQPGLHTSSCRSHCSSWSGSGPVSTAWGAGLAPVPCSSPDLQTLSGPHAVWVIQAHKGVIKIHSKLISASSVLMSVAERHSRSGWRRALISSL